MKEKDFQSLPEVIFEILCVSNTDTIYIASVLIMRRMQRHNIPPALFEMRNV